MSGGSMDYLYRRIEDAKFELNTPERIAFKQHLDLVAEACKAIELVDSDDNSEGSEKEFITKCLNNLDNVVITKDTLTPLLRRQLCNLEAESARIVADNMWDLINEEKFEEAKLRIHELEQVWGRDSELSNAEILMWQFDVLKEDRDKEEDELVTLLSTLYKDAQMGIDEEWVPTYDKEGWEAQQVLIDTYCKNNNIKINKN